MKIKDPSLEDVT